VETRECENKRESAGLPMTAVSEIKAYF